MTDVSLRDRLVSDDLNAIDRILRATGAFRDEEVRIGLELVEESLNPTPHTDYEWVIAEREGKVVGFACFGPVALTDRTFDLYWIAVDPSVKGLGIAAELDQRVEDRARSAGGRLVLAETSSTEPYAAARRFYLKRGYSAFERIPDFYRDGDDRITFGKRL